MVRAKTVKLLKSIRQSGLYSDHWDRDRTFCRPQWPEMSL